MKEQIIYKSVDELVPYENNPRDNEEAVEYVANSIREFGFKVPIVIDENNIIVAGHTRLKASKVLGIEEVPVIVAKDLTDEQVKAFRLADNKTNELADWDYSLLQLELDELLSVDMKEFGFDEILPDVDIDGLFESYEPEEKEDDKELLKWSDKKVELSDRDLELMDNAYYEHKSLGLESSFVEWLVGN